MKTAKSQHTVVQNKNAFLEVFATTDKNKELTTATTTSNACHAAVTVTLVHTSNIACKVARLTLNATLNAAPLNTVQLRVGARVAKPMVITVTHQANVLVKFARKISALMRNLFSTARQ